MNNFRVMFNKHTGLYKIQVRVLLILWIDFNVESFFSYDEALKYCDHLNTEPMPDEEDLIY